MIKFNKKCPFCPGNNITLVSECDYYKIFCPDCGASIVTPKKRKKLSGGGHKLKYGVLRWGSVRG